MPYIFYIIISAIKTKVNNISRKSETDMTFFAFLAVIIKSIIYGSSIFFTGRLTESVDVLDVLSLRFLISFVLLWILKVTRVLKINVGVRDFFRRGKNSSHVRTILLAALFEPVLYMFFETLGISMSTGIMTAVILSLGPIFSCVMEMLFLKERSTALQKIFLGIGIFGVIYISVKSTGDESGSGTLLGIVFLVLAILSGSLFSVFSRKSSRHFKPMEISYISCMLGTVIFNAVNVIRHLIRGDIIDYFEPYFDLNNIIGFLFLGVVCTIIATSLSNYALSKMQVSTFSAFGGLSTFITIIVDVIFNGAPLYYYHYIGLACIFIRMFGVSAISIKRDRDMYNYMNSKSNL